MDSIGFENLNKSVSCSYTNYNWNLILLGSSVHKVGDRVKTYRIVIRNYKQHRMNFIM